MTLSHIGPWHLSVYLHATQTPQNLALMYLHCTGSPSRLVQDPILMTECPVGTKCAVQDDCAGVVGEEASELIVGCIFYF